MTALASSILAAANPVEHVVNHKFWVWEGWWLWSAHMGNLVLSLALLIAMFMYVAKHLELGPESMGTDRYMPRRRFAHMIEVIMVGLRDMVVRPLLGSKTDRFMPFLWTLFFFILINNLLGMVPLLDLQFILSPTLAAEHKALFGGTATQNLWVTGALAIVSGLVINISAVRGLGLGPYVAHLTAGTPWYLWPIMVPLEILGTFIKPAALALRLFANMTAGHVLLATLYMLVGMALYAAWWLAAGITILSVLGGVAIFFLEVFIAFLQAFLFMFLTTVFVSLLSHEHEHEHGEHPAPEVDRLVHGTPATA